ncbi:MAG: hypothetical protein MMC23_001066 [Stictis urceolatum]|nr:hypothetical protein [Stictis urceolata]
MEWSKNHAKNRVEGIRPLVRQHQSAYSIVAKPLPSTPTNTRMRQGTFFSRVGHEPITEKTSWRPMQPFARRIRQYTALMGNVLWLGEILSFLLAFVTLAAIITLLGTQKDKPLPAWPSLFSLNSLLSVLSSIMKTALLYPIAEGIGELKWIWFAAPQPISDFDRYDSASRGPWGAFQLIVKRPRNVLVSLGAFITVLAIVIDPFNQQVIQFGDCQAALGGAQATISRTNRYSIGVGTHIVEQGPTLDGSMAVAVYEGLLNPPANASAKISTNCESGNCTFPSSDGTSYTSLAICAAIDDLTHVIEGNGSLSNLYTLPSGLKLNGTAMLTTALVDSQSDIEERPLIGFEALMINSKCTTTKAGGAYRYQCSNTPFAFTANLYPCVHTYGNVSIKRFNLQEQIISTSRLPFNNNTNVPYYSLVGDIPFFPGVDCTPLAYPQGKKNLSTSLLPNGLRWINYYPQGNDTDTLYYDPACGYELDINPEKQFLRYMQGIFGSIDSTDSQPKSVTVPMDDPDDVVGDPWLQRLFAKAAANITSATAYTEGLANSMTAVMRQQGTILYKAPAQGTVLVNQTCVRVEWVWMALPAALLFLAFFFLAGTIIQSRRHIRKGADGEGRRPWKSSSLPLLWCGLQDATKERYGTLDEVRKMKQSGDEMVVSLRRKRNWATGGKRSKSRSRRARWILREEATRIKETNTSC